MKVLDAGAYGVIVPLVNSREEAEQAVWSCRYPPAGGRSSGPTRAAMYGGAGYQEEANDEIAVICMIETAEALENLDEILSVPGRGLRLHRPLGPRLRRSASRPPATTPTRSTRRRC